MALKAVVLPSFHSSSSRLRVPLSIVCQDRGLYHLRNVRRHAATIAATASSLTADATPMARRSANFQPNVWDYTYVQSLSSTNSNKNSDQKIAMEEVERMKEEVKGLILNADGDPLAQLELIDSVQRLGLGYQFREEIIKALGGIYEKMKSRWSLQDLHSTALGFRILRQHKFFLHQDVFNGFVDNTGSFKEALCEDVNGLLSLYEASFHGFRGESVMNSAMAFSGSYLKKNVEASKSSPRLARKVVHALDMPLHWRPDRLEARWYMDVYAEEPSMNPTLLKLAKLDYNMVQSIHKKEVGNLARWWVDLGVNRLDFARDRLMEHYLWTTLVLFEPRFQECREMTTKIISMVTTMDDVYDVFGTIEELELLTDFIERWDVSEIDKLPMALKACFLAMYNTSNDIGYWAIKEHGFNVIPYIHKMWADQGKAWLREAKWHHIGHKPDLQAYLDTAVTSIGGLLMMLCCYILTTDKISKEALDFIAKYPSIMWCSTTVLRLNNDLATSAEEMERGDTYKSIHCYMNDHGVSEDGAREHMKEMVREMWKTMNEDGYGKYPMSSSGPFLSACLNLARASQCFYQYGDGHGRPDGETKSHLMSVLVQPVPIE